MFRIAIVIAAGVGLTACNASSNQAQWTKPGASNAQIQQDALACEYEAKKSTGHQGGMGQALGGAIGEGIERSNREAELKGMCLQTRGYQQAAAR